MENASNYLPEQNPKVGTNGDRSNLFDYGIQNEGSDIRAHVGPLSRHVYVFQTAKGLAAFQEKLSMLRYVEGSQRGVNVKTFGGYPMPISWIPGLREIKPFTWPGWEGNIPLNATTSEKGKFAVDVVVWCLKQGRFPLWLDTQEDERMNIQIKGTDITIFGRKKIQVKFDLLAGPKPENAGDPKCSGNLFIQTRELNPLHRT